MKLSLSSLPVNLEWWNAQKRHKGALLVNRQEPFLAHCSNKEITLLGSQDELGQSTTEGRDLETGVPSTTFFQKQHHAVKTGVERQTGGVRSFLPLFSYHRFSHLKKKAISASLQRSIKLEICLLLILFGELSTLKAAPKLSVLGGSLPWGRPPLPSQPPVTPRIISVQRAVLCPCHILKG